MRSSHAILEGPMAGPADPPFTGLCADCGEDFGDHCYEMGDALLCIVCCSHRRIQEIANAQPDDFQEAGACDEIAKCRWCDKFRCECRDE